MQEFCECFELCVRRQQQATARPATSVCTPWTHQLQVLQLLCSIRQAHDFCSGAVHTSQCTGYS